MLLLPREIAAAGRHVAVGTAIEDRDDMLLHVEIADLLPKRRGRRPAATAGHCGHRCRLRLGDVLLGHPQDDRAFEHAHAPRGLRQDNLARQLAAILLEIGIVGDLHADDVGRHWTFGA